MMSFRRSHKFAFPMRARGSVCLAGKWLSSVFRSEALSRFRTQLTALLVVGLLIITQAATSGGRAKRADKPGAEAARRNAVLSNELTWKFGGKQQRGWYLYIPLIKELINTKNEVGSSQFAQAVGRWQAKSRLAPSGIIDEETLYAMIKAWQEARLKDRTVASPDQLITAPIADFYDPTRAEELRQVERRTYEAYKRLVAAAVADRSLGLGRTGSGLAAGEKFLKIISAFRSPEYQEKLRRQSPNSGTAGLAVNSPHFTGRALDLYVGGDPVDTQDSNRSVQVQTRVYQWLVRNADRFGFRPYCYEPWHWEYVR